MAVFYNQATLSYSGGTTNSNITTGQIIDALTATKTAVSASYVPGDRITYVVSLISSSDGTLTDLTVTDDLGGYDFDGETVYPLSFVAGSLLFYVDGVLQATPSVVEGPPLTISGISIPPGENVMLIYEAIVTEYAPLGDDASITNTVSVSGACPAEAQSTVCMNQTPRLTLSKAITPGCVTCKGEITYTMTITNTGQAATSEDAIVLSDTFDPLLHDIAVTLDGMPLTEQTDYAYDESTGEFATIAGAITVPAATFAQNSEGAWITTPGVSTLEVTGTL